MNETSFASLSPTLLARKGGAKPAMRRQSIAVTGAQAHQPAYPADAMEDLGWNDLGEDAESSPATHTAASAPATRNHDNDGASADGEERESEDSADEGEFAPLANHAGKGADPREETATVTPIRTGAPRLPRPRLAVSNPTNGDKRASSGKRTAFTLRLDAQRHLKLRMASTLAGRSAQSLVTEAVDAMFADIPELDALVARVQSRPQKEG